MRRFKPRFFRPRSRVGGRIAKRWTGNVTDGQIITTASLQNTAIVAVGDYAQNAANLEPDGPTLARIRGFLTIDPTVATAFTFWAALGVYDESEALGLGSAGDPSVVGNIMINDWLWWYSCRFGTRTVLTSPDRVRLEIDVKAKRRMKDMNLYLTWICTNAGAAGTQGTMTASLKALLIGNQAS